MKSIWVILLLGLVLFSCTSTIKNPAAEENSDEKCTSSSDCTRGEMCNDDGQCIPYCSSSYSCPDGYTCNMELNQCEKIAEDGDSTTDGDATTDGDNVPDGDTTPDGDEMVDGDTTPDGDDVVDGDTVPDGDDVVDGDQTVSACNPPCGFGWVCNETSKRCVIDRDIFPYYCLPCNNNKTCDDNNQCYRDRETYEEYCVPPCIEDTYCMDGIACIENYCLASNNGCGLPRPIGAACNFDNSSCAAGLECLESINGRTFPNGICTSFCTQDQVGMDCGEDSTTRCTGLRQDENDEYAYLCLKRCNNDGAPCREGYDCAQVSSDNPFDPNFVCVPQIQ